MQMSCEKFLEKLASQEPVPGGGGAAALGGAVGAALAAMVANLTLGKAKFAAVEPQMQRLLADSEVLRSNLLQLVQEDAKVFEKFMQCYKMPKVTEPEQAARAAKIQEAAKTAASIPLQIAEQALAVVVLADTAAAAGNPAVITDAAVAALMAQAAVRSAVYNVKINLNLLQDTAYCATVSHRLQKLETQATAALDAVLAKTDRVLAK